MAKRVLILTDNEPVTCRALALELSDAGLEVVTAADAEEAADRIGIAPFDLLIAGEGDPGSEAGLLAKLRTVRPRAQVVFLTTNAGGNGKIEASESGVRVRKPFDLEEFRSLVQRLMEPEGSTSRSAK